jgi:hypothetical protein
MTQSSNATAVLPQLTPAGATGAPALVRPVPLWARLFMPSIADVFFAALLFRLTFWGQHLLDDADIGWHIRNGQHILTTHAVPRADYFSYTMSGQPWYAWEWLYDAIVAGIHAVAGLNGVVLFSACLVALVFALLFRLALKASGNLLVALCLTLLAGAASLIHLLARPHLVTWLFTLVFFQALASFQRGERKQLLFLPALMLLWVNLHGGFLAGIAVLGLFIAANLWTRLTAAGAELRGQAQARLRHLGMVLALTLAATMVTPYGYRLYVHLHDYLGSGYLMDHIAEFQSPDFHLLQIKAFAVLLIAALLAPALGRVKASALDVLVMAFSAWVALYAVRNLPIASILLTLTAAPMLGTALSRLTEDGEIAPWMRRLAAKVDGYSTRMGVMEQKFKGHALAAMMLAAVAALAVLGASSPGKGLALQFDAKRVPVQAAEYMAAHNIRDHFYAPDDWSGYLIYRLYPDVRVMMDDRHDFYGEKYVRDFLRVAQVSNGWREVLDAKQVNWVLIPPTSPLASTLKETRDWKVVHDDGTAILFERTAPLAVQGTEHGPR